MNDDGIDIQKEECIILIHCRFGVISLDSKDEDEGVISMKSELSRSSRSVCIMKEYRGISHCPKRDDSQSLSVANPSAFIQSY